MKQAQKGDRVRVDFTGTLEDGTIFDTTADVADCEHDDCSTDDCKTDDCGCGCDSGPLELTIGHGDFFPLVEEALIGMTPGEKKSVRIPADEAFGQYEEERVFTVPRNELPEDLVPEVGQELVISNDDDEPFGVTVLEVSDEMVTFDANHPLAGEDLHFEIQLLEVL